MQKKIVIGLILLLIAAIVLHKSKMRIDIDGSLISIDSGSHHIEGTLGPESTYHFIMKDEGVSINTFSGDCFVMVLPLKTAEELRAQYGDFFRCNAPCAIQDMQSMRGVVLVTDRDEAKDAISEALGLVRESRIPVVGLIGSRIHTKKVTYLSMNVEDHAATGPLLYYVNELKILKQDYLR
jgi:hypothetical protein